VTLLLISLACTVPDLGPLDLGTVRVPASTEDSRLTNYSWKRYQVGFALDNDHEQLLNDSYRVWGNAYKANADVDGKTTWMEPRHCTNGNQCAYEALYRDSRDAVWALTTPFRSHADLQRMSALERAELVVSFVQQIEYEIPKGALFGLVPPALVAHGNAGDCDSKSLLALMMLAELGIDSVLFHSTSEHHAVLGIAVAAPGTYRNYKGRRYALVETTSVGWRVGRVPPSVANAGDWQGIDIRVPRRRGASVVNLGTINVGAAPSHSRTVDVVVPDAHPAVHHFTLAVSDKTQNRGRSNAKRFAKDVGYEATPNGWKWFPPTGCSNGMACVFQRFDVDGRDVARDVATADPA
jgi:hypothetical protein